MSRTARYIRHAAILCSVSVLAERGLGEGVRVRGRRGNISVYCYERPIMLCVCVRERSGVRGERGKSGWEGKGVRSADSPKI